MDTDEESKPSSLAAETDVYLTEHLAPHISATRYHLTGAPEPPEPPYAPSFHPPTGYWTAAEKALFFRALSVHSRFRPDLIAASIATKSTVDVAVYLSLLRDGATRASSAGTILRDLHPVAYEVSPALVALEEKHAARVCVAGPAQEREAESEAREEEARAVKNGMRVRRGEGGKACARDRDREGQDARREAFGQWHAEREVEWAREDALGCLDVGVLQVLDRMFRMDKGNREEADAGSGSGDEEDEEDEPSITLHSAASSSSRHATTPPRTLDDDVEDDYSGAIPSNISPAERRLIRKRLYMRRKRAEASGSIAQLDPARLKPGRKSSATSKYRQPFRGEENDSENEAANANAKQPARGDTRPYKIQRDLERLGIGADYLRANGMDLFHLGALGRLMQLYPRLDTSRPQGVAESIAAETIQMLHALVAQFTRGLVRRALALRKLDFALRAHTKVWRLGERVVSPLHVRRALELCGGIRCGARLRSSRRAHFEALLERFSEGEESSDDGEDEDDVPLAVRARIRKGKSVAQIEDEDEDEDAVGEGDEQQQQRQQAGPSTVAQAHHDRSSPHHAMYSPFVHAPDLIAPAHPFGVYAPGTTPEPPLPPPSFSTLPHHAADHHHHHDNYSDEEELAQEEHEDDDDDDLMPAETDDEALAAELHAEALLDAADARTAAAYEAGVWRELRGDAAGPFLRRSARKRRLSAGAEMGADDAPHTLRKRRRRQRTGALRGDSALLASPDGVKVKSAAIIEDSDSDAEYLG